MQRGDDDESHLCDAIHVLQPNTRQIGRSVDTPRMTLDEVIATMYGSVSFEPGGRPAWERYLPLFAPDARLVRVNDDGVFEFTLTSFRANIEAMIDSGALPSFWEGEIGRETRELGGIADVFSIYETRDRRGGALLGRAVKSIQLFRRNGVWQISAMLWRRESERVRLDDLQRATHG